MNLFICQRQIGFQKPEQITHASGMFPKDSKLLSATGFMIDNSICVKFCFEAPAKTFKTGPEVEFKFIICNAARPCEVTDEYTYFSTLFINNGIYVIYYK